MQINRGINTKVIHISFLIELNYDLCEFSVCKSVGCKKIRQMAQSALFSGIFLHENTQENQDFYTLSSSSRKRMVFSLKIFQFFWFYSKIQSGQNSPRLLHEVNVACFFISGNKSGCRWLKLCLHFLASSTFNMQRCNQPTEQFFCKFIQ